jgi:hypothetical protein
MYSKHVQFNTWSNEPPPLSENIPIPYNRHVRQPPIRNLPQPITKQFQNQQPNLARHPLEQGFEIILEALKQIQTRRNTIEKKQADPGIAPNYPTLPIKMINTKPTIPNLTNAIPQKNQRYLPNPQQPTTDIPFHKNQHYKPNLQQPTTGIPFQKNQHYQLNPNQQHHQPYPQSIFLSREINIFNQTYNNPQPIFLLKKISIQICIINQTYNIPQLIFLFKKISIINQTKISIINKNHNYLQLISFFKKINFINQTQNNFFIQIKIMHHLNSLQTNLQDLLFPASWMPYPYFEKINIIHNELQLILLFKQKKINIIHNDLQRIQI